MGSSFREWMAMGLLVAGAACAPTPGGPPPGGPQAPAAPATQPVPGGTLRVAVSVPIPTLQPYGPGRYDMGIGPGYDRLVEFRNDEKARFSDLVFHDKNERGLAEKWEYASPTTLVMNLKKDVKWHDGQPFTSADVAWTVQWARDPLSKVPEASGHVNAVDKVETPDAQTVRFITKQPSASLLNRLAFLYVVPKHLFDRKENLTSQILGTGPFKQKEYIQNQKITLERFPDYYWQGRPYLQGFEAVIGLDYAAQNAAFVAEKLDAQLATDKPQYDAVRATNPNVRAIKFYENFNNTLRIKLTGSLSDVRVRKAIHLAIDRQEMVDAVDFGDGVIPPFGLPHAEGRGIWTLPEKEYINEPGFRKDKTEDLREAKRLLAEAGHPNGFKLVLRGQQGTTTAERIVPVLIDQLKRNVGIEVDYQGLAPALYTKAEREGDYGVVIRGSRGSWGDPESFTDYFYSKAADNTTLVKDAEWDRMVEEQQGIVDPAKRVDAIRKMLRYLGTTYWSIPLVNHGQYYLTHPWVNGTGFPQKAIPDLDTMNVIGVWLSENAPGRRP